MPRSGHGYAGLHAPLGNDYVDGMALGAPRELGVDASRDGYRVTFELDTDWFPAGHRFSERGANSVPS